MAKSAIQIITEAYSYAGIVPSGAPLNGKMSREGLSFLNELLYKWNIEKYFPFTQNTLDADIVGSSARIAPDDTAEFKGERPLSVTKVLARISDEWIELQRVSYGDIFVKRDGYVYPTFYAFTNNGDGDGIIEFDTENGNFKCRVIYNKSIPEMDYNDILKAPAQYEQLLKYGVAVKVCTRYGVPADVAARIEKEQDDMLRAVETQNSFKHTVTSYLKRCGAYEDHALAVLTGRHL